jgi:hypothetical protein
MMQNPPLRLLLVSIVPPQNDCGVRIVMHRHLVESGLCHMAARAAKPNDIPLVGLFLDWFPIMPPHLGHEILENSLSRRYRRLYRRCDLAICTRDGMKEVLGSHPRPVAFRAELEAGITISQLK